MKPQQEGKSNTSESKYKERHEILQMSVRCDTEYFDSSDLKNVCSFNHSFSIYCYGLILNRL